MTTLDMIDSFEQAGVVSKRARDGAQTADVLGVSPPRVMAAAVSVRDERDAHRTLGCAYRTGLRLRLAMRSVEPPFTPAAASDADSSRISKPRSLTTNSSGDAPLG
jgi:hypothetical protein